MFDLGIGVRFNPKQFVIVYDDGVLGPPTEPK